VVGFEGAASGGNIGSSIGVATPGLPGDSATYREKTDLLTSITARVGYAWNNWLFYGKGGGAWASDRYSAFDALATYDFEGLETRFGWTAGAGVEWAFWNDWSVKLEYDYYGFGNARRDLHRQCQRHGRSLGHQTEYSDRQTRSQSSHLLRARLAGRVVVNDATSRPACSTRDAGQSGEAALQQAHHRSCDFSGYRVGFLFRVRSS
jgi:opacity protein-like surface antigen